jgi:Reverse transcriptase (RNA-dependent DNA polymerase)
MWVDLFTLSREHYLPNDDELVDEGDFRWPKLTDNWLNPEQLASQKSRTRPKKSRNPPSQGSALDKPLDAPAEPAPHPEGACRSQRIRNQRMLDQAAVAIGTAVASSLTYSNPFPSTSDDPEVSSAQAADWDLPYEPEYRHVYALERSLLDPHDGAAKWLHPCVMQVRALDSDSPTFWDIRIMSSEEQQLWEVAMNQELTDLVQRETFSLVPGSSVPKDTQIVPCQWVLKKKRRPDLSLIKYKARLCLSGNRQQLPDDENDTYAPVADWSSICLLFSLVVALGYASSQVDFKNAFLQTPLEKPYYMAIPPGFTADSETSDQVIKLHKSIYGDKWSPRLWYFHLRTALTKLGFKPSPKDACLFIGNNVTLVVHVDNCLIVAPTQAQVDKVISDLRVEGLHLDKEDDIAGYLGVAMDRQADGTIHL